MVNISKLSRFSALSMVVASAAGTSVGPSAFQGQWIGTVSQTFALQNPNVPNSYVCIPDGVVGTYDNAELQVASTYFQFLATQQVTVQDGWTNYYVPAQAAVNYEAVSYGATVNTGSVNPSQEGGSNPVTDISPSSTPSPSASSAAAAASPSASSMIAASPAVSASATNGTGRLLRYLQDTNSTLASPSASSSASPSASGSPTPGGILMLEDESGNVLCMYARVAGTGNSRVLYVVTLGGAGYTWQDQCTLSSYTSIPNLETVPMCQPVSSSDATSNTVSIVQTYSPGTFTPPPAPSPVAGVIAPTSGALATAGSLTLSAVAMAAVLALF